MAKKQKKKKVKKVAKKAKKRAPKRYESTYRIELNSETDNITAVSKELIKNTLLEEIADLRNTILIYVEKEKERDDRLGKLFSLAEKWFEKQLQITFPEEADSEC